jgi:hypothetical protein
MARSAMSRLSSASALASADPALSDLSAVHAPPGERHGEVSGRAASLIGGDKPSLREFDGESVDEHLKGTQMQS